MSEAADKAREHTPLWRSREFAYAFFPIALVLGIVVTTYFYLDYTTELDVVRTLERSHAELGRRASERRLKELARDVRILAESQSMLTYLAGPSEATLARMARDFVSLCRHRGVYDQVRYLSADGQEVLRIDYDKGACIQTPADRLQNKARRYYFKDAFRLSRSEVFYSPMDLNIEHGVIERPFKPMIRIGMPVFDQDNRKRGIVLVNYLAEDLRAQLREMLSSERSHPFVLNRDGYWLLAYRAPLEWGFMFQGGPRFSDVFPKAWQSIETAENGQVSIRQGIFSWSSVFPVEEGALSSTGASTPFQPSREVVTAHEYVWRVGTHVPAETVAELWRGRIRNGVVLYIVLLAIATIGSLFLAYAQRRAAQFLQGLQDSERRLRAVTAELGEGLVLLDSKGSIRMINPKAEQLLGWTEAASTGLDFHDLVHAQTGTPKDACMVMQAQRTQRLVHVEEDRFLTRSGDLLPVAYTASPFFLAHDEAGIVLTFEDITARKQAKAKLAHLATHDSLTGLANRREIQRCLDHMYAQAARYDRPMSICVLDVDHFKGVNDKLGHLVGDEVLRQLSQHLHDNTRSADCIGRYGGEEFLLVLPDTDLNGARRLSELIRAGIEDLGIDAGIESEPIQVTVSIGMATLNADISAPDDLIKLADEALYRAKNSGRNQVCTVQDEWIDSRPSPGA